ncbi:MAG: glycosyltransferase [Bacteroidota bacterium]
MKFIDSRPSLYGKYVFILDKHMFALLGNLATSENYHIEYFAFDGKYTNSISRSFYEWQLVSQWIDSIRESVKRVIFMSMDERLILITTKRFKKYKLSVKGILFQPYVHYKEVINSSDFIKKYIFQRYAVFLNNRVEKFYVLNDKQAVEKMNTTVSSLYNYLPDPVENGFNVTNTPQHKKVINEYALDTKKKNLLVFGMIDARKNLINIIDALRLLPNKVKKVVHLLVVGKLDKPIKNKYLTYINDHTHEISIRTHDKFVSKEEREVLFTYCNIILMPYINFYSSSGILGHAIRHQKHVIASNQGLVGRLVAEKNLGITVNPLAPEEIKDAICQLLYYPEKYQYNNTEYLQEHSPENFSKTILTEC